MDEAGSSGMRNEGGGNEASDRQSTFRLNRDALQEERKDEGELAVLADANVAVYNAVALEQGFLQQVFRFSNHG